MDLSNKVQKQVNKFLTNTHKAASLLVLWVILYMILGLFQK